MPEDYHAREDHARGRIMPGGVSCQGPYHARGLIMPGGISCQGAYHARGRIMPGGVSCQGAYHARGLIMPGAYHARGLSCQEAYHAKSLSCPQPVSSPWPTCGLLRSFWSPLLDLGEGVLGADGLSPVSLEDSDQVIMVALDVRCRSSTEETHTG